MTSDQDAPFTRTPTPLTRTLPSLAKVASFHPLLLRPPSSVVRSTSVEGGQSWIQGHLEGGQFLEGRPGTLGHEAGGIGIPGILRSHEPWRGGSQPVVEGTSYSYLRR